MEPTSTLAVGLLVLTILPGAMYTWAFERQVSAYGVTFTDRAVRFFALSMGFHAVFGWIEYLLFRHALTGDGLDPRRFAAAWVGLVVLITIPTLLGTMAGGLYATRGTKELHWRRLRRMLGANEDRFLEWVLGRSPAPRAWDAFFSERPTAYLRLQTIDGHAVAGLFADSSYAAGYPNDPDLFLEEEWTMDEEGALVAGLGYPVYIASGQIARLEVVQPEANGGNDD